MMVAHAYSFYALNYLDDTDLIIRYYDHYVHHLQQERFKKDERDPGSVRVAEKKNGTIKNRKGVSNVLSNYII